MSSIFFPFENIDTDQLNFYKKYKIQIPFFKWNQKTLFRISIQAYNSKNDIYKLIHALKDFRKNK